MDFLSIIILLFIGCIIGFLAGFFGVGGGVILVPVLLFFFATQTIDARIITHLAMGTSLFIVVFASFASALKHQKQGNVFWKGVLFIGVSSIITAAIGTTVAAAIPGEVLQKFFAIAVLTVSLRLFFEKTKTETAGDFNPSRIRLVIIGITVGFLSALTGIGGGVFSIPLMYFLANFPIKRAIGTSSATVIITASTAVIGYALNGYGNVHLPAYTIGFVDYLHAIPLIIGTVIVGPFGAAAANKTSSLMLRKLFAIYLFANSIFMFIK